ncbi:MAG: hypothetical protein WA102_13375 [Candidatus Methanoperedens sp.]
MKLLKLIIQKIREILGISSGFAAMNSQLDDVKILTAKIMINHIKSYGIYENIHETEFKVFSQWGTDGIIQYLINNIEISEKKFIEFGVQYYTESNTRFLLINNNWKGLVIDGNKENIDYIKKDPIYWRRDLTGVHYFINKDNINNIISDSNFFGEIGILSIDLDGNDYWIWECINVVDPIIVIIEYNSVFGYKHAITIPYNPTFDRTKAHYSNLFFGCSLKALCLLAEKKGYIFVGSDSSGNNAFFIRNDKIGNIKSVSIESGYVKSKFRESRDIKGQLSYLSSDDRLESIEDMLVYDVEKNSLIKIKELY